MRDDLSDAHEQRGDRVAQAGGRLAVVRTHVLKALDF